MGVLGSFFVSFSAPTSLKQRYTHLHKASEAKKKSLKVNQLLDKMHFYFQVCYKIDTSKLRYKKTKQMTYNRTRKQLPSEWWC